MLNKKEVPTIEDMKNYCGMNSSRFESINEWLINTYHTITKISFPSWNNYGWCISHSYKKKLICNVFPEEGAFAVMLRLSNEKFMSIMDVVSDYTKEHINNRYPCNDGGWIQYPVIEQRDYDDIIKLKKMKYQ